MTKRATCSAWWQSYEGEPKGWGASGSLGGRERGWWNRALPSLSLQLPG